MTWLEILWSCFWRSLLWRQHERPYRRAFVPAIIETPAWCRAAWKETTDRVRHNGLPTVARLHRLIDTEVSK